MKISAKLIAIIFAAIAAFASVSCEKSESNIKPEEILGSFTCNGNTYNIRSVVVYPLDNGQTEIWISETAGWELKPIKGWVKASALPSGAQVTERKWTYTLREFSESSSSSKTERPTLVVPPLSASLTKTTIQLTLSSHQRS